MTNVQGTSGVPDSPDIRVPPPLIFIAGLLAGLALSYWLPTPLLPHGIALTVGILLMAAGVLLAAWAVMTFKFHGTTVRPDRPASVLVVAGPFEWTRNPMYVALATVYLGLSIAVQSLWAIILLAGVLYVIRTRIITREEAFLERRFGDYYREYKKSVGRWF